MTYGAGQSSTNPGGVTNSYQGAVYVFTEPTSGGWQNATQTAKLVASDGEGAGGPDTGGQNVYGDCLGSSVAISGDTIVAGSPRTTAGMQGYAGKVYVFTKGAGALVTPSRPPSSQPTTRRSTTCSAQAWPSTARQSSRQHLIGRTATRHRRCTCSASRPPAPGCPAPRQGRSPTRRSRPATTLAARSAYPARRSPPECHTPPTARWPTPAQSTHHAVGGMDLGPHSGDPRPGGTPRQRVDGRLRGNRRRHHLAGAPVLIGNGGPKTPGSAYVFTAPSAGAWSGVTQAARLTASDAAASELFGYTVGLSGSTIAVGAPGAPGGASTYLYDNGWPVDERDRDEQAVRRQLRRRVGLHVRDRFAPDERRRDAAGRRRVRLPVSAAGTTTTTASTTTSVATSTTTDTTVDRRAWPRAPRHRSRASRRNLAPARSTSPPRRPWSTR